MFATRFHAATLKIEPANAMRSRGRAKRAERGVPVDHATLNRSLSLLHSKSCRAALEGIEVANMIRKGQLTPGPCPFAQFAALAA